MRLHKCVHKWGYWVCFGFCVPIGACRCVNRAGRYSNTHLSHRGEDTPAHSDTTGLPVGLYPAHLSVPELVVPVALAPIQPPPSLFHTLDVATTPRQALSLPVGTQTRWQLCPSARLCSSWVHHNEKKTSFIHKTFLERNILANNGKSKPLNQELCLCECIVGKGKCFCCSKSELGPEIPFVSDVSEQKLRGHEP